MSAEGIGILIKRFGPVCKEGHAVKLVRLREVVGDTAQCDLCNTWIPKKGQAVLCERWVGCDAIDYIRCLDCVRQEVMARFHK